MSFHAKLYLTVYHGRFCVVVCCIILYCTISETLVSWLLICQASLYVFKLCVYHKSLSFEISILLWMADSFFAGDVRETLSNYRGGAELLPRSAAPNATFSECSARKVRTTGVRASRLSYVNDHSLQSVSPT